MIYAVGDIHGQITMLRAMLEGLPIRDDDTLLFLGDYIDRGENSCAVIEALIELKEQRGNVIFLRGNHEQMMLDARDGLAPEPDVEGEFVVFGDQTLLWLQNGGADALLSYGLKDPLCWWESIPEAHWDFVRSTQYEYITDQYHFVHAGLLPPGASWDGEEFGLDYRLWVREPFLSHRDYFNGRIVIFGHTPQMNGRPLVERNKIGLDTGAVFGGPLTAAAFDPRATGRRRLQPRFYLIEHARA